MKTRNKCGRDRTQFDPGSSPSADTALVSLEDTLRQENNRIRMASMRSSETQGQTLERLEQNRTRIASMRASETQEQTLERLEQKRTHVASMRASETQRHHGQYALCKCIGALRVCTLVLFIDIAFIP